MPNPDDPDTHLTVWADPLDARVVAEDLDDLRAGVREGLDALADASVELENDVVLGNLLKFERVYCFRESGAVRKRKQWLLYVDSWIVVLTWQGSNPEEYDYWYAMANYSFASFSLPEALWPFLDRDLFLSGRDPSPGG
jgi:hypothetical protein